MTFEEVKSAVMSLSPEGQKRLIMEVVPSIWPKACLDEACVDAVRNLVDEATLKEYQEQHMASI